jgi:PAS domain S-box-containing protein
MDSVWNVIDRKRIEEDLLESERKFRETVINLDEGFYSVTLEGELLDHNQAFCHILGFDKTTDLKGKLLFDFWQDPEDRKSYIQELSDKKSISGYTINAKTIKGEKITVLANAHFVSNKDNRPVRIEGILLDITERRIAEDRIKKLNDELENRVNMRTAQLESANKELEAFSYSVSHDLRAPLRSVHGFTKILLEEYNAKLDDEGKRICGIISTSATKMSQLIDDLLTFSRIGRSSLHTSLLDMKSIVGTVFMEATNENDKLRTNLKMGKLHKACGDASLIRQVWHNLILNAIKYSSNRALSEISIGSRMDGNMITYYVKDNGVGFDMKYQHKLFGVFQRLHSEAEFEGNGVGLAIVQRIINKHNGKVWAEGATDMGSTFYFTLPVQDNTPNNIQSSNYQPTA